MADREFRDQILDSMELERERGITIKSNTVTLLYEAQDGERYQLNLIDTPGHVDFSHEVRRSLMSCEGALILVDASQGVEAQTVANLYLAMEYDLTLLPVINKIDLPAADVERAREEIDADLGLDPFEAIPVSAKLGQGVDELLEGIVEKPPAPVGRWGGAAPGADLRRSIRRLSRASSSCAKVEGRHDPKPGRLDPAHAHGEGVRRRRSRAAPAQDGSRRNSSPPVTSAT